MADEVYDIAYGKYSDPQYNKKDPIGDMTLNVTADFSYDTPRGKETLPHGSYQVVENTTHGGVQYSILKGSDGEQYIVPNSSFQDHGDYTYSYTNAYGEKVTGHKDYVDLWANSYVVPNKDYKAEKLPSGSINLNNSDAAAVGYNTFKDSKVSGDVEIGYATRRADSISGQQVNIGGSTRVVNVPYKVGETVIVDGKEYKVDTYTAENEGGYDITLKAADGSTLDTTTQKMIEGKAKVVESAIPKGATYGYHAEEAKAQQVFRDSVEQGTYKLADKPMDLNATAASQKDGVMLCSVQGPDGKSRDAFVQFDGKGGYTITDKATGKAVDAKDVQVRAYELKDGDHTGHKGQYQVASGSSGKNNGVEYDDSQLTKLFDSSYTLEDTDPSNDVPIQVGVVNGEPVYCKRTKNNNTFQLCDAEGNILSDTELTSADVTAANNHDNLHAAIDEIAANNPSYATSSDSGYQVAGIISDSSKPKPGVYTPGSGDTWVDPNASNGSISGGGGTSWAIDRSEIYDDAMWGHNITQKATLPGMQNGTPVKYNTSQDAIAQLVSSGQWTRKDATKYVNDAIASGQITVNRTFEKKTNFYSQFETIHKDFKGEGSLYVSMAANLKDQVSQLRTDCDALIARMEGWEGSAKGTALRDINTIKGRLARTMQNIEEDLEPAVKAIEELDEKLEELKAEDEILKGLLEEQKAAQERVKAAGMALADYTSSEAKMYEYVSPVYETVNGERKKTKDGYYDHSKETSGYKAAKQEDADAKEALAEIDQKVEDQQKKETEMEEHIKELIELVQRLDRNMRSLRDHVSSGGKYHSYYENASTFADHYKELYADFSSYNRFPVLTNATDYQVGDIVAFDDSYGYLYKVVEVFDGDGKTTGYLKIVRCDANGNPIPGSPVLTIWDQREISPVKGELGRRLWSPPITVEPKPKPQPSGAEPKPTTKPKPTRKPDPKPPKPEPEPQPKPPTTKPQPKPPTTQQPIPSPTIITGVPAPTLPVPTRPTPPPIPTVPMPTYIPPTRIPVPEPPTVPIPTAPPSVEPRAEYIPHTGIDVSLSGGSSGETQKAGIGAIGALAGIMAGAAGVGMTAMAKDKDKDDEDKEKEEGSSEEVK